MPLGLALSSPLALRPWDGGVLELSGVFGGSFSFASNSATRAVNAAICSACACTWASSAMINASFSDGDRAERSDGGVMGGLTHIPALRATEIDSRHTCIALTPSEAPVREGEQLQEKDTRPGRR